MAGQFPSGTFSVSDLVVKEPATADLPTEVISPNGPFTVSVTFKGGGNAFKGLANNAVQYRVDYWAEGYGANAPELTLGTKTGNLAANKLEYKDADTQIQVNNPQLSPGTYEVMALVTIPSVPGLAGHLDEEKIISVV